MTIHIDGACAPSTTPGDVDAWITEQHAAALVHREQCVATIAALRAEIATVEATIARLDVLIHGRGGVPARIRPRRGARVDSVSAYLTEHPRCSIKALTLAVYGRDDGRTMRCTRAILMDMKRSGKARNVGIGQWEVV